MSCQTIQLSETTATICHSAAHVEVVNRRHGETRWCFKCRKRREFRYIVTAPVVPDYYGPNANVRCGTCNTSDGDLFPGGEREWE